MTIPAWYINLDRSPGRREHMEKVAADFNLPLSRLPAVDGLELTPEELEGAYTRDPRMHQLSMPEIACFLSHRKAWGKIAKSNAAFGAVFEDDVTFAPDAFQFFQDSNWIPEGASLIKVETTSRKALLLPPFDESHNSREVARLGSPHMGGGGYIVSRTLAKDLVAATTPFSVPVDYLLFHPEFRAPCIKDAWQINPAVCVQQVRTKRQFLPDHAEASGLDTHRKVLKRRGIAKVFRELSRPFVILKSESSAQLKAWRAGGRWTFIHFRD